MKSLYNTHISSILRRAYKIFVSFCLIVNISNIAQAEYTPLKDMEVSTNRLIIRGNYAFAPFESIDENGEMKGFDVDLMRAMMKVLNYKYDMNLQNLDLDIQEAQNGKIDVIMGLAFNKERSEILSFGIPICYINRRIISLDKNPIDSKKELIGKRISVQEAGWAKKYLQEEKLSDKVFYARDMKSCLQMLEDGKVDAVIASDCASFYEVRYNNFTGLHYADLGIRPQAYSYAVPRGKEELLFRMNEALQVLKATGEYDEIYNKWFGVYENRERQLLVTLLSIFCSILLIAAIFLVYRYRKQSKRARRRLKDSYEQLQLALDAGNISVWIYNLEEKNVYPLSSSKAIKECIQVDKFLNNADDEDRKEIKNVINKLLQHEITIGECRFRHKVDDRHKCVYYESKMKLIEENEVHPTLIIGTLKDITKDVLEQQRLIKMRDKAEKDNQLKSAFLANMSHDIRTPLGAIAGFNDVLNGDMREELNEDERKLYLNMISTNIEIVTTLVNEVLDLAKFESGTYQIRITDTNIDKICRTTIENVRGQVQPGVELKYTPCDENLIILTDSVRLQQVLTNYMTNACKHTTSGEIELNYIDTGDYIKFTVTDTGCGIKPEDAEVCFDRFKMLNNNRAQGTGLGLYICKLIADMLKGKVYVDLSYTNGAKFVFELPKNDQRLVK